MSEPAAADSAAEATEKTSAEINEYRKQMLAQASAKQAALKERLEADADPPEVNEAYALNVQPHKSAEAPAPQPAADPDADVDDKAPQHQLKPPAPAHRVMTPKHAAHLAEQRQAQIAALQLDGKQRAEISRNAYEAGLQDGIANGVVSGVVSTLLVVGAVFLGYKALSFGYAYWSSPKGVNGTAARAVNVKAELESSGD